MTELKKFDIIQNEKGEHYKFVSLENTEKEAQALCEDLVKEKFQPATFERPDNHLFEVYIKFTLAEEIIWVYERNHCDNCPEERRSDCHPKSCKIKGKIEDTLWKERLNLQSLLKNDLKNILGGEQK